MSEEYPSEPKLENYPPTLRAALEKMREEEADRFLKLAEMRRAQPLQTFALEVCATDDLYTRVARAVKAMGNEPGTRMVLRPYYSKSPWKWRLENSGGHGGYESYFDEKDFFAAWLATE